MRTESTPLGKYDEAFNALFWEAHPYLWPVVGWPSDIPMYTLAQAKDYFATYYAPNNITGVLVGDFKIAEIKPLLERYFGRIPRGKIDPPPVVTLEPKSLGEQRYSASAETSPTVRIWWKGVPFVHKDAAALDLLSDVLSGRTGRLYKGLVLGQADRQRGAGLHRHPQVRRHLRARDGGQGRQGPRGGRRGRSTRRSRRSRRNRCEPRSCRRSRTSSRPTPTGACRRPSSSPSAHGVRRPRRLAVHQQRGREGGRGDAPRTSSGWRRPTSPRRTGRSGVFLRKEGAAPEDPAMAALSPAGPDHGASGPEADRGRDRRREAPSGHGPDEGRWPGRRRPSSSRASTSC